MHSVIDYIRRRYFLIGMFILGLCIVMAPSISQFTILTEYIHHFVALFFLIGVVGVVLDKRSLVLSSFGVCAFLCVNLISESETAFVRNQTKGVTNQNLNVAMINLSSLDDTLQLASLKNKEYDLLTFVEVTPDWKTSLVNSLSQDYPNYQINEGIDLYGKAVFSKFPFTHIDTIYHKQCTDYVIQLKKGGESIRCIVTYVIPSLDATSTQLAEQQLNEINKKVDNSDKTASIVVGEFNTVHWSTIIKNFKKEGNYNNCRREILPASLNVPSDQIFHNKELKCLGIKEIFTASKIRIGLEASYSIGKQTN